MPRQNRIVVPGLPHHITQRGNARADVFDCDQDRVRFLELLARYSEQYSLSIWGYCLMTNHFHLIVVPAFEDSLPKVIGRLESDYARFINLRRGTPGHLWQARYHAAAMEPLYCWRALSYVERNPVRAGMVTSATDYPWSSAAARMGQVVEPAWLSTDVWRQHWTPWEWRLMLGDRSADEMTGQELRDATMSGHPLGAELVDRLERESGKTFRRGKMGRPRRASAEK